MKTIIEKIQEPRDFLIPRGTRNCQNCGFVPAIRIIHKDGRTYCPRCQNEAMRRKLALERNHNKV